MMKIRSNPADTEIFALKSTKVAIIGSGLIGRGWAIVFARAGWSVNLHDVDQTALDQASDMIDEQLQMLAAPGLCAAPEDIARQIKYVADVETAVSDVDYVQECGPEVLEVKRKLFSKLDELTSDETILASSTSGFMTSQFSEHLAGRQRVVVAHPVNPPHLVPLVEVSPAEWTDSEITAKVIEIMATIGQTPISVNKEIPGFILNRLQGALLNEALRLAQGGYATPDDIDKCVRDGLGHRWSFMGPFETIDLNAPAGLADYAARYGPMYHDMAESQSTPPNWQSVPIKKIDEARRLLLDRADISERQSWRDQRLASLVAHKNRQKS